MLLQTNHSTEQLSHCILAPPYLTLPAAGSELLQPVRLQRLVLLRHLQEQRVGELQPLGQLQGQGDSRDYHTSDPQGSTWAQETAALHNTEVKQHQPLLQDLFPHPHHHRGGSPSHALQSQQGWLSTSTEMPKYCVKDAPHIKETGSYHHPFSPLRKMNGFNPH